MDESPLVETTERRFRTWAMLMALAVFCIALGLYVTWEQRQQALLAENRNLIELAVLDQALEWYRIETGQPFPTQGQDYDSAIRQMWKVFPRADAKKLLAISKATNEMDDAEILVFFLSGRAAEMLDQEPRVFFDFDVSRLVDADGDGWLEYSDRDGETFRLIDGRTAIYCEETDRIISVEPLTYRPDD